MTKQQSDKPKIHAYARDHKGKLKHKTFDVEWKAEAWKSEIAKEREAVKSGKALPKNHDVTLQKFSIFWLQEQMKTNTTPTVNAYERNLRVHILPFIGQRKMSELHHLELETFLDEVQEKHGLSNATRNRLRACLSSMWTKAKKLRVVDVHPFDMIEEKKENPAAAVTIWSVDEAKKYLETASGVNWSFYLFVQLSLNTGMRKCEMLALQKKHVFLEQGAILVEQIYEQETDKIVPRTKSEGLKKVVKVKYVGINPTLRIAFQEFFANNPSIGPESYLVAKDGIPIKPRYLTTLHTRVCERAGIRHSRIHDMRHLAATLMKRATGSLTAVQENHGHSTPMTTKTYTHEGPEDAAARLKGFNPFVHHVVTPNVSDVSEMCPDTQKQPISAHNSKVIEFKKARKNNVR